MPDVEESVPCDLYLCCAEALAHNGYDVRKALYELDEQVPLVVSVRKVALRHDFPAIWAELKRQASSLREPP